LNDSADSGSHQGAMFTQMIEPVEATFLGSEDHN